MSGEKFGSTASLELAAAAAAAVKQVSLEIGHSEWAEIQAEKTSREISPAKFLSEPLQIS